jgi:acylpyruvate hydrolase
MRLLTLRTENGTKAVRQDGETLTEIHGYVAVAYAVGSIMLAAALLAAMVLIVPAERAVRRNSRTMP